MPIPSAALPPLLCVEHSLCFELMKGAPAAVVAVFGSALAAMIAYRQYRVAKAKLNLDLFEKRYELFEQVWALASAVMHGKVVGMFDPVRLNVTNALPKIEFLFGAAIAAYVREINESSAELYQLHRMMTQPGYAMSAKNTERRHSLIAWFGEQAQGGCQARFGEYLDVAKW
ncbi:hypothetical protein [Burkholderia gladioli]|uniref:hypothetical protein n=1 Tax=Burkholderia gladioli TaxID=28095 RepID=UPI00163F32BA|nr:hypothetical protein [Burkholderia gladioli]